ncbi:MAG: tetraacyldisaccharide 4'-kinase [Desulfobulbaceae bacterium]|jgi:tetraacyldisaccharide 4'-kinase|nr:tetraacyldisaccharide 4'-kinase [Desulfobulbaceae bacterium]
MTDPSLLFAFGRPFSPLYSLAMRLRERAYARNLFRRHQLPVPVISVGNLVLGGSGKTPTVAAICRHLLARGEKPAVISRGYGGQARAAVNIVSDGDSIFLDARAAGDEPYMLATMLPGVAVLTGRKRIFPCQRAVTMGRTVLVLDDGFQHLAIRRDLDLVLFNATSLAGNSRVFPGGELREPVAALRRADAFVLTGVDGGNRERAGRFAALLNKRFPDKPVFQSQHMLDTFVDQRGQALSLPATPLLAVSAIAHPERFHHLLAEAGVALAGHLNFLDHHRYPPDAIEHIAREVKKKGATALIVTEKDRVKLAERVLPCPLFTARITAVLPPELLALADAAVATFPH